MIDIHNHILFGVDDGPEELKLSLEMVAEEYAQGVTDIVLTPHFRLGMFRYDLKDVERNFRRLQEAVRVEGIPIKLFLGCEFHAHEHMIDDLIRERVKTMAGTNFVLVEFEYGTSFDEMMQCVYLLTKANYQPIIAHVERYACLVKKPKLCGALQETGAMIQCNANALIGLEGKGPQKMIKKLLKHEWVDVIASDAHDLDERAIHLKEAYDAVEKKYGSGYAKWLFERTPRIILDEVEA